MSNPLKPYLRPGEQMQSDIIKLQKDIEQQKQELKNIGFDPEKINGSSLGFLIGAIALTVLRYSTKGSFISPVAIMWLNLAIMKGLFGTIGMMSTGIKKTVKEGHINRKKKKVDGMINKRNSMDFIQGLYYLDQDHLFRDPNYMATLSVEGLSELLDLQKLHAKLLRKNAELSREFLKYLQTLELDETAKTNIKNIVEYEINTFQYFDVFCSMYQIGSIDVKNTISYESSKIDSLVKDYLKTVVLSNGGEEAIAERVKLSASANEANNSSLDINRPLDLNAPKIAIKNTLEP